jgi:hypothetical protein
MYLKISVGIAIFAISTVAASPQDDPTSQAPKPTVGDKSKLRAYCELGHLHDETQQAVDENDAKAIDALIAKTDALEQQLGPEYDTIITGLDQIDFSSVEGQEIADVLRTLHAKCE